MLEESYVLPTPIIVVRIVATWRSSSPVPAYASPRQTVSMRPGRMTSPRASSRSPLATESRLTSSSTVRTRKSGLHRSQGGGAAGAVHRRDHYSGRDEQRNEKCR